MISGCASLSGNKELIAVDSVPRGAEIYLADDPKLYGKTPKVVKVPRALNTVFRLQYGPAIKTVVADCSYRYLLELVGNGVLTLGSPALGAIGFFTDWVSGAAFDCAGVASGQFAEGLETTGSCQRFLVIPPSHADPLASEQIVNFWWTEFKKNLKGCVELVPPAEASAAFSFLNVDHHGQTALARFDRAKLNTLAHRTEATHLVKLNYRLSGRAMELDSQAFDIFQGKTIGNLAYKDQLDVGDEMAITEAESWVFRGFTFLPNSLTVGSANDSFEVLASGSREIIGTSDSKSLPDVVSSFGATTVVHPDAHPVWDFGTSLSSDFDVFYCSKNVASREAEDHSQVMHQAATLSYAFYIYFYRVEGHTAVGAFGLGIGAGPYLGWLSVDKVRRGRAGGALSTEVTYTAFLTRDVFVQLGGQSTNLIGPDVEVAGLRLSQNLNTGILRLGYFFPEMQRSLRGLW